MQETDRQLTNNVRMNITIDDLPPTKRLTLKENILSQERFHIVWDGQWRFTERVSHRLDKQSLLKIALYDSAVSQEY